MVFYREQSQPVVRNHFTGVSMHSKSLGRSQAPEQQRGDAANLKSARLLASSVMAIDVDGVLGIASSFHFISRFATAYADFFMRAMREKLVDGGVISDMSAFSTEALEEIADRAFLQPRSPSMQSDNDPKFRRLPDDGPCEKSRSSGRVAL
uniref:Uncharacterized protein n=1 Tax=Alexandrium catenella TaxID=2925 RepID=A0A6T9W296_ALECA